MPPEDPNNATPDPGAARRHLRVIGRGGATVFVGNLVKTGLQFVTGLLVSNTLGATIFGQFGLAMRVEQFSQVFADAGLPQSNIKFVSRALARGDEAGARGVARVTLCFSMALSLALFVVVWLLAPWIAEDIYYKPHLAPIFRIAAAAIPLLSLTMTSVSVFQAARNILPLVGIVRVGVPALFLVGTGVVVLFGGALPQLMWAYVAAAAVGVVVALTLLIRWLRAANAADGEPVDLRELGRFAGTVCVGALGRLILSVADVLILMRFVIAEDEALRAASIAAGAFIEPETFGVYVAATRMAMFVLLPLNAINPLLAPTTSALFTRNDMHGMRQTYRVATRWCTAAAFAIAAPLIIAPTKLFELFGKDFTGGEAVLIILALGQLVRASTGAVGNTLNMTGGQGVVTATNIVGVVALVGGLLILPRHLGIAGAALCEGGVNILANFVRLAWLWRRLRIQPYDARFGLSLAASAAALLMAAWLARAGGTLLYAAVALALFYVAFGLLVRYSWLGASASAVMRQLRRRPPAPEDSPDDPQETL